MTDLQEALKAIDQVIALRLETHSAHRPSAAQALYLIDRIMREALDRDGASAPLPDFKLSA